MKKMMSMLLVLLMLLMSVGAWAQEDVGNVENADAALQENADESEAEKEWWNILFLGGDSREVGQYGLTDSIIILSINREECLVKMTSIMRDTWVEYPERHTFQKINAANVYGGPEMVMETVNRCFGTDIEHYVLVNMHDLVEIIDLVGGIELSVTPNEKSQINKAAANYLSEFGSYSGATALSTSGDVHLNGLLAVAHTRNRSTDSDYGRVMRQQAVLLALAETMQNLEVNELMELVDELMGYVQTNLENEEMKGLATTAMAMDVEYVEQFRIPADKTYQSGLMEDGIWKIVPDLEANTQLLHDFIYGVEEIEEINQEVIAE